MKYTTTKGEPIEIEWTPSKQYLRIKYNISAKNAPNLKQLEFFASQFVKSKTELTYVTKVEGDMTDIKSSIVGSYYLYSVKLS